jgi:RNA polymerase sigma factor (sigma-70 family)
VDNVKNEEFDLIIEGCVRKIEKSQEKLYKKFFGYALSVAMIYANHRDDAIEVVDDSFMKVFNEISRYNTSMPFKSWFRRIIINTAIDRCRRNNKHQFADESQGVMMRDESASVESQITASEIIGLLNHLPPLHKLVFSLYELEGYSHEEIANLLNIPESSSRVYLTRAKKHLRDIFPVHFDTNLVSYGNR